MLLTPKQRSRQRVSSEQRVWRARRAFWFGAVAITLVTACGDETPSAAAPPNATTAMPTPTPVSPSPAANGGMVGTAPITPPTAAKPPAPAVTPAATAGSPAPGLPPTPEVTPSGTAGNAASVPHAVVDTTSDLPCSISQALASNCQKCHAAQPLFGAPMPLMTKADLQKPSELDPAKTIAQAAVVRMNDEASPMPPRHDITTTEKKLLLDYFAEGKAPASMPGEKCVINQTRSDEYLRRGLVPGPDETCYDFQNHASQSPGDKTKYSVKTGEHYEEFLFKVPWGADMVATQIGSKLDNIKVAHHWLFYSTNKTSGDGTHTTTIGSVIGSGATLLAGWALGGDNQVYPKDMGVVLPENGMVMGQWHYYNTGSQAELDGSAIQVCVAPRSSRKNIAGITWLGTEALGGLTGIPAKSKGNKYSGTCVNDSGAPITLWGLNPHMHKLGRHMTAVVRRKDGKMETVFDLPFDFNAQISYPFSPAVVLEAGDSITSTCTFDNPTDLPVGYGPSSDQEMCYNFAVSYPLGALNNGVFGLNGALNNCW